MASPRPWNDSKWKRLKPRKRNSQHESTRNDGNQNSNTYRRPLTPPLPMNGDLGSQKSSRRPWRLSHSTPRGQQTFHQAQSPLLRSLPAEIRLIIWWYFLCSQKLHVVLTNQHTWKQSKSKMIGLACSERRAYCPCSHHCWGQLARRPVGGCIEVIENADSAWHEQHASKFDTGRANFVPLLQTCRMIYSEAIDMIYQENTFLFNHTTTIVDMSHTLLPQRLNLIRNVHLSFSDPGGPTWGKCCQTLATKMPNLRHLTIHLYPHVARLLDDWLMSLHQIRQASVFEVRLIKPWYLDPQWEISPGLIDAPFQFALADTTARRLVFPPGHTDTD